MIYFAYDGTLHSDWVSNYAVRMAARHPSRAVHLIYVDEQQLSAQALEERLARMDAHCRHVDVQLHTEVRARSVDVFRSLQQCIPAGPESLVICGTRSQQAGRSGWLCGTVSERLLQSRQFTVLVMRIMNPGLLGAPRDLLVPVSGHPRGLRCGLPLLELLAQDIERLHILHVKHVFAWRYRMLTHQSAEQLSQGGRDYCHQLEREVRQKLGLPAASIDTHVIVSDDVPKEIVLHANKVRSRLIFLGASERSLRQRVLYGHPIEQVLRNATCDVGIYRGIE